MPSGQPLSPYLPHAVIEDVVVLPGNVALPRLGETLEYDPALAQASCSSFKRCVKAIDCYPDLLRANGGSLDILVKKFASWIFADKRFAKIYSRIVDADIAYLKSIFA